MPDFLRNAFAGAPPSDPIQVFVRIALAVLLGGGVALVYLRTRDREDISPTFPATLVLLAALIAMVTQVVGDNVARAFSLVGALSIVRFRTVVRDTQDTAFVIFAVVVGMAIGSSDWKVAGIGLLVVGFAALAMRPRALKPSAVTAPVVIRLRLGLGHDLESAVGATLDTHMTGRHLLSMATTKQGLSIDVSYAGHLRSGANEEALVKTLNRLEGIQGVELTRRTAIEE
jgi:hypothetical protein